MSEFEEPKIRFIRPIPTTPFFSEGFTATWGEINLAVVEDNLTRISFIPSDTSSSDYVEFEVDVHLTVEDTQKIIRNIQTAYTARDELITFGISFQLGLIKTIDKRLGTNVLSEFIKHLHKSTARWERPLKQERKPSYDIALLAVMSKSKIVRYEIRIYDFAAEPESDPLETITFPVPDIGTKTVLNFFETLISRARETDVKTLLPYLMTILKEKGFSPKLVKKYES